MSHLYITDDDIKLGYAQGRLTVCKRNGGKVREVPFSTVEGISVYGQAQLSTQLIRHMIEENKGLTYYSEDGHYFGGIDSFDRLDPMVQKKQIDLTDNLDFCLCWAYRIIYAKIQNSISLLKSLEGIYRFSEEELSGLVHSLKSIEQAETIEALLGFEGNAAKCYFRCLGNVMKGSQFEFKGRSARPPKDPFNSMLSFGYSLLYRNIIGSIKKHGLHPYFAFLHKVKPGHAALASDLIEEYRAYIVDRCVIEFVNSGEVCGNDFYLNESGAIYMNRDTCKALTERIGDLLSASNCYFMLNGNRQACGFQVMLDRKMNDLVNAIKNGNPSLYSPFVWMYPDGQ